MAPIRTPARRAPFSPVRLTARIAAAMMAAVVTAVAVLAAVHLERGGFADADVRSGVRFDRNLFTALAVVHWLLAAAALVRRGWMNVAVVSVTLLLAPPAVLIGTLMATSPAVGPLTRGVRGGYAAAWVVFAAAMIVHTVREDRRERADRERADAAEAPVGEPGARA